MYHIDFPGTNKVLGKPSNMTNEECAPLRVLDTGDQIISYWKPSEVEREAIANGGSIALIVYTNTGTQPPVCLFCPDVQY